MLQSGTSELGMLRRRLAEVEAALAAVGAGEADGLVGPGGVVSLRGAERPYQAFFDSMHEGGLTLDAAGRILSCNPRFAAMLGSGVAALRGRRLRDFVASGSRARLIELTARGKRGVAEVTLTRPGGGTLPTLMSLAPIDSGGHHLTCLVVTDLREQSAAAVEALLDSEAFSRAILDAYPAEIAVLDADGTIVAVNRPWQRFAVENSDVPGEPARGTGVGSNYLAQCPADIAAGIRSVMTGQAPSFTLEYACHSPSERRWFLLNTAALGADGCGGVVVSHTDITERRNAEEAIKHLAFYDTLTSLPNRRLLLDRLGQALSTSERSGRKGALLFIDLDNFKTLNDTLGHDVGDLLLQQVAQRLKTCVREGDTVARLGGDEFVVMLEALSADPMEAAIQTEGVGEKILAACGEPYLLAGHNHHSSPSLGATVFDGDETHDDVLKRADMAMYKAKHAGRNTLRFFDPEMQETVNARARLEGEMREGLGRAEFRLHYQPQIDGAGRLIGVEALVRWDHPRRGLVMPDQFIRLAEETGLILHLGRWVLEAACAQLVAWSTEPATAELTLAVNVSARQFRRPDLVDQVAEVLVRSGADPRKLKLELTESLLLDDIADVVEKMTCLRDLGLGFSLDDFGTGYSSLSYLKRLPLDHLKIDKSFVGDILTDPNDAAIATTIVALGHSMGLGVIAEGVETADQRDALFGMGCQAYQGYLVSRPLTPDGFEAFARDYAPGANAVVAARGRLPVRGSCESAYLPASCPHLRPMADGARP